MTDMSMKPATVLGTQPARAISDISEGVSTHSAWASAIAFGTSGGFSPTSAENKTSSFWSAVLDSAGRPAVGLTGVTGLRGAVRRPRCALSLASPLRELLLLRLLPLSPPLHELLLLGGLFEACYARHLIRC